MGATIADFRQVALGDRLYVDSTVLDTAAGGYKAGV